MANLTRQDGIEMLELAPKVPIRTTVTTYPLAEAEQALADLRAGAFEGTARPDPVGRSDGSASRACSRLRACP